MLLLVIIYYGVINPLMIMKAYWTQELIQKRQMLERYQDLQAARVKIAKAHKVLKVAVARAESQLLSGANPAVAAADLQEIMKNLIEAHGAKLITIKVMPAQESDAYVEVPIQVQVNSTIEQMLTILYHLEHHKKLLFIRELDIHAPRRAIPPQKPVPLRINLVVSGIMKKGISS